MYRRPLRVFFRSLSTLYMYFGLHLILHLYLCSSLETISYRSLMNVCVKISIKSITIGNFVEITSKRAWTSYDMHVSSITSKRA